MYICYVYTSNSYPFFNLCKFRMRFNDRYVVDEDNSLNNILYLNYENREEGPLFIELTSVET